MVVVNSTKGDALVDKRYLGAEGKVTLEQRLADSGVEHEVRQTMGRDIADEILAVAAEVDADAIVIGIRHRSPGRQADHGQRRAAGHHRRGLPGGRGQARLISGVGRPLGRSLGSTVGDGAVLVARSWPARPAAVAQDG